MIGTGAVAAVADTFASDAADLAGWPARAAVPMAAAAILALSSVKQDLVTSSFANGTRGHRGDRDGLPSGLKIEVHACRPS